MKDKIRVAIMTLLVILLLAMAGGFWIFVGKQAQEEKSPGGISGYKGNVCGNWLSRGLSFYSAG